MKLEKLVVAHAERGNSVAQTSPSRGSAPDASARDTFDTPAHANLTANSVGPWWLRDYVKAMPPLVGAGAIAAFGDAVQGSERFASVAPSTALQIAQHDGTVTVPSGQSFSLEVLNYPSFSGGWEAKTSTASQPLVSEFDFTAERPGPENESLTGTSRQLVRYTWSSEQIAALGRAFTIYLHYTHPRLPGTRLVNVVVSDDLPR